MNAATLTAFMDELTKIKTAGLMRDLGTRILSKARSLPRAAVGAAKAAPGMAVDFAKSLPGHARGSIQNAGSAVSAFSTPIDSLKRGAKMTVNDFGSLSGKQKALLGVGLAASAHEMAAKEDPLGQNRSRVERVATGIGDQVGGLIGTPFGLTGGFVAGQIGRRIGGAVGRGVDHLGRSRKAAEPAASPILERPTP